MTAPLLQLNSVSKDFGAVRALKGVSFDLQAGEVHALLGENGAGKSTLIKLITGAHQPDSGTILLEGQMINHLTPATAHRLGITCIYQQPALFPDLSVEENIALRLEPAASFRRIHWPQRRAHAVKLLNQIGARMPPDEEVGTLSMPEQQLVEIACAVGARARIVIMDEPTASLTEAEVTALFKIVREMRAGGVGIIYISHRLDEIFALADRVTVLRDGESVGTRTLTRASEFGQKNAAVTESQLIQMMVGREVSSIAPSAPHELGENILALKNVRCRVAGVLDVSLEVRSGEIVGLFGLVGAGRTELARILFGITPADSGEISINGLCTQIASPSQAIDLGIAYLPEDRRRHGLILEMPVSANISMAIHRRLFPNRWLRADAECDLANEYIDSLSIKTSGPEAPGDSLSGGNQQKVALARWLATKPKLLILDEPTQGVDVGAKSEIHQLIRRLAATGVGVLMISSDLTEILGQSDRIAVMRRGTIAAVLPKSSAASEVMASALGHSPGKEVAS